MSPGMSVDTPSDHTGYIDMSPGQHLGMTLYHVNIVYLRIIVQCTRISSVIQIPCLSVVFYDIIQLANFIVYDVTDVIDWNRLRLLWQDLKKILL